MHLKNNYTKNVNLKQRRRGGDFKDFVVFIKFWKIKYQLIVTVCFPHQTSIIINIEPIVPLFPWSRRNLSIFYATESFRGFSEFLLGNLLHAKRSMFSSIPLRYYSAPTGFALFLFGELLTGKPLKYFKLPQWFIKTSYRVLNYSPRWIFHRCLNCNSSILLTLLKLQYNIYVLRLFLLF